jgi:hypothetical protein
MIWRDPEEDWHFASSERPVIPGSPARLSLRLVRCRSRDFRRASKSLTFLLTVDFGIPSCVAAVVKLPACTTRAKTSISLRSMAHCSTYGTQLPTVAT